MSLSLLRKTPAVGKHEVKAGSTALSAISRLLLSLSRSGWCWCGLGATRASRT